MVNFDPTNSDARKRLEELRRRRGLISDSPTTEAPTYTPPEIDEGKLDAYFNEQFRPNQKRTEEAKTD